MNNVPFRARLFKSTFNPVDWKELDESQISIFKNSLPDIMAVRAIEYRMLCAFTKMAKKHANKWASKSNPSVDVGDYVQEALMAILDAIYSYTDESIRFGTFVCIAIRNRLSKATNNCHPLSPLTNEAIGLLMRYDEAKLSFNGPVNQCQVYEAAGFTLDEIKVYETARVCVYNEASLNNDDGVIGYSPVADYTELRRGIDNEDTVPCNFEIRDAVKKANLTELEQKIVDTYLNPYYGWQAEIASQETNTKTNKPLTRQAIRYLLQRALDKIKAAYIKREVA
jgi:hypothetical protein